MTWSQVYNRHKQRGCDPSDAAYRADQSEKGRKSGSRNDEAIRLLSAALDLCVDMFAANGLNLPHTVEKVREAQSFANASPSEQISGEAVERGWQDISTAPKDGTDVLTWTPKENHSTGIICGIHCGFYEPHMKVWMQSDLEWEVNPSHWMPLPPEPKP